MTISTSCLVDILCTNHNYETIIMRWLPIYKSLSPGSVSAAFHTNSSQRSWKYCL